MPKTKVHNTLCKVPARSQPTLTAQELQFYSWSRELMISMLQFAVGFVITPRPDYSGRVQRERWERASTCRVRATIESGQLRAGGPLQSKQRVVWPCRALYCRKSGWKMHYIIKWILCGAWIRWRVTYKGVPGQRFSILKAGRFPLLALISSTNPLLFINSFWRIPYP